MGPPGPGASPGPPQLQRHGPVGSRFRLGRHLRRSSTISTPTTAINPVRLGLGHGGSSGRFPYRDQRNHHCSRAKLGARRSAETNRCEQLSDLFLRCCKERHRGRSIALTRGLVCETERRPGRADSRLYLIIENRNWIVFDYSLRLWR